ncbi:MAG: FkbM family methyltransferase [Hyphomonadaceae bacterium]
MTTPGWTPPSTLEEKLKRAFAPPKLELARIVARELKKGEPELRLAPFLLDPARAALDIGANRGVWSHVLARHCPRVFAFEPNPKMFAVLKAAAPANVECHHVALSDRDGTSELLVPRYGAGYSNQHGSLNPARVAGHEHGVVQVAARRLDSFDLPPIGFMKIDVEGHERAVIEGATALIARDKPALIVEIEQRHTHEPVRALTGRIEALGYEMFFLGPAGLTNGRAFDPETMQRDPNDRRAYVNNFVFLAA